MRRVWSNLGQDQLYVVPEQEPSNVFNEDLNITHRTCISCIGPLDGTKIVSGIDWTQLILAYCLKVTAANYSFIDTWAQMEALLESGKCKSIGVSNFSIANLELLLKEAKIIPVINQCELHPYLPSVELKTYCEQKDIHLQAFT